MYYYRHDLAVIHDQDFSFHADRCAPGILELLAPVRDGLVLEIGCGSGALTRHLLAEHGVDASVRPSFGTEQLPPGLHVVAGSRRSA